MKILIHKKALNPITIISSDEEEVAVKSINCTVALWELAEKFPDELIGWCEESFLEHLDLEKWEEIFHHDLIMASYAVESTFLPERIGYVEQLPFANLNRDVLYGTWRMSRDVGGIYAGVLLRFKPLMGKIKSFEYLLNSVAKLGQQNSLFCYSAPKLIAIKPAPRLSYTASTQQLISFVYQHYNGIWLVILTWCLYRYENRFPLRHGLKGLKSNKFFKRKIDLSQITVKSNRLNHITGTIDVIIPTMGRPDHLYNVLKDFSKQTHLPQKVIIVEQNAAVDSHSELDYLKNGSWPFEIIHHFIHQTGACNSRNLALSETTADWVFFSDDDHRFEADLLEKTFRELKKYGLNSVTTSYLQKGEKMHFKVPKQWGTFGAGNSIVLGSFARSVDFSPAFEHGYGEDMDYGMQLRGLGCDIIYHPGLSILHLKAGMGGFREKQVVKWEEESLKPKPSPTLMAYALKFYTKEQLRGFKTSLFLRFYKKQSVKNPLRYYKQMKQSWASSKKWANRLLQLEVKITEKTP